MSSERADATWHFLLALSLIIFQDGQFSVEKRTFNYIWAQIWKCFCTAFPKFCTQRASTKR